MGQEPGFEISDPDVDEKVNAEDTDDGEITVLESLIQAQKLNRQHKADFDKNRFSKYLQEAIEKERIYKKQNISNVRYDKASKSWKRIDPPIKLSESDINSKG